MLTIFTNISLNIYTAKYLSDEAKDLILNLNINEIILCDMLNFFDAMWIFSHSSKNYYKKTKCYHTHMFFMASIQVLATI